MSKSSRGEAHDPAICAAAGRQAPAYEIGSAIPSASTTPELIFVLAWIVGLAFVVLRIGLPRVAGVGKGGGTASRSQHAIRSSRGRIYTSSESARITFWSGPPRRACIT